MDAACYRHPDCVRRLIDAGADVAYSYPGPNGPNGTIIYMTASCFSQDADDGDLDFEEGSVIRTVGLLLEAGAPANKPSCYLRQDLFTYDLRLVPQRRSRTALQLRKICYH